MKANLAHLVPDPLQREVNEGLINAVNLVAQFVFFGDGAPTFSPTTDAGDPQPAVYIRLDGDAASTLYVYDVTTLGWTAK